MPAPLITRSDMLLVRASRNLSGVLWHVAALENNFLASKLRRQALPRPIVICGLARSGSTLLLELLSRLPGIATSRYRDFPMLAIPWLWNMYVGLVARQPVAVERPHRDGIMITAESPEAMDEPLWRAYASEVADDWNVASSSGPGASLKAREFSQFYRHHMQKIQLIRGGRRVVVKNNYHIARLRWLAEQYDAQFIIPVRHPLSHVTSLVQQHQLFCRYAAEDPRVTEYMQAAAHFEFGPQRQPFAPTPPMQQTIRQCWDAGDDWAGYAWQWRAIYEHVWELLQDPQLCRHIHLVGYEEFCLNPNQSWSSLCTALELSGSHQVDLQHVTPTHSKSHLKQQSVSHSTSLPQSQSPSTCQAAAVWTIAASVASQFGYAFDEAVTSEK